MAYSDKETISFYYREITRNIIYAMECAEKNGDEEALSKLKIFHIGFETGDNINRSHRGALKEVTDEVTRVIKEIYEFE